MTTPGIAAALTAALLVQTAILHIVLGDQAPADVVLVVVVLAALSGGPLVGLWTGTAAGLLQDLLSGGVIGVSGLAKSLTGVLVGASRSWFVVDTVRRHLVAFMAASIVHAVCFVGVYTLVHTMQPVTTAFLASQVAANGVAGAAVVAVARAAPGALRWARLRRRDPFGRRRWIVS